MQKRLFFLLLFSVFVISAQAQFGELLKKTKAVKDKIEGKSARLSTDEIARGLKEALDKGVGHAVSFLSSKDGYYKSAYKILIPEDARRVTQKLKMVPGWEHVEQNLEEKMNRAAELAAKKAKPIFVKAIKEMSFQDAMNILKGEDNAATRYLHKTTYSSLYDEFLPVIRTSLQEVNATRYWNSAVTAYNKIPLVKKANPDLDDYVTRKALDGLFDLVAKKEHDIRQNPAARTSDLLKKVFGKQ